MPYTLRFKTPELESKLRPLCEEVFKKFELPAPRLLCFVDDESPEQFDDICGSSYSGFHTPVIGSGSAWPDYIEGLFFNVMGGFAYDNVIYINGRTSAKPVGTLITLAHELRHFLQFAHSRKVWMANTLVYNLLRTGAETKVKAWDIPFEKDAMRVSKRIAEEVLGEQPVTEHAKSNIAIGCNPGYWEFFDRLSPEAPFDLLTETKPWVERYRSQLVAFKRADVDFRQPEWWK